MSSLAKKTPMTTVANSGAEDPAAMKVAPATSGDNLNSEKSPNFFLELRGTVVKSLKVSTGVI